MIRNSPNREQFLFLGAGGIILGLILVVVVFNMMGNSPTRVAEEETNVRPVVTLPPQKGLADPGKENVAAAVFNEQGLPPLPEEVPARVNPEGSKRADTLAVVPPGNNRTEKKPEPKPEPVAKAAVKPEPATPAKSAPAKPEPATAAKAAAKPESVAAAKPLTKPEPAAKPAAQEAAKAAPATAPKAATGPDNRFAINMGAFKEEAKATTLKGKLAAMGLPTYLQQTTDKNGTTFHRVRVGPYANRTEAESISRMVKDRTGSGGTVIPYGQ